MNVWLIILIVIAIILIISAITLSITVTSSSSRNTANVSREAPNIPPPTSTTTPASPGTPARPGTRPGTPTTPVTPARPGVPARPASTVVGYFPSTRPCEGTGVATYGVTIGIPANTCTEIGGKFNPGPTSEEYVNCHMNICQTTPSPANYVISPDCPEEYRRYGVVADTTVADCRRLQGSWNGNPGEQDWVQCHSYVCRAPRVSSFVYSKTVGTCPEGKKIAYGSQFSLPKRDCDKLGGSTNLNADGSVPSSDQWVKCYMDICRS